MNHYSTVLEKLKAQLDLLFGGVDSTESESELTGSEQSADWFGKRGCIDIRSAVVRPKLSNKHQSSQT